jgi:N-acetylated-alpha-linked acidic dipeptidase
MKMKFRHLLTAAAVIAAPLLLRPAVTDAIRGFDPVSQAEEQRWEREQHAVPDAQQIGRFIEKYSNRAHLAGTPASQQTAEDILAQLKEFGLDAHIERYEALLPVPKQRSLEIVNGFRAKLEEPAIDSDKNTADPGMVPSFNAYSGDGDVTAPLVYVNYGVPADYDTLKEKGIDVKGKIVIARYGGSWRGIKPKVAQEHGAVGCLIYSDPRDDGYYQGDVYPKGAYRPADGVQRGSVLDMVLYPGDPLSPGWASEAGSKRLAISEATTLMKIPVIPISYADAEPLLATLEGPVAPPAWRGALPLTYHMGPGTKGVHLKVSMDNSTHGLYDVIVTIPGSEFPDEWVLIGNHHDAWVHGASDPLSGAAPLMEVARSFAELGRKGWKPKRTIKLAFWDGEEFGLMGSTEFMEKHADELSKKLVVYINSDSNGKGVLQVGGSHTLETFTEEVARDINDPETGKPLLQMALNKQKAADPKATAWKIAPLGSGSDYTPFIQHLGIASLNMSFGGEGGGGVYHSNYDDFQWYSRFSDGKFVFGRALAQVNGTAIMRLADAPLLPFEFDHLANTVTRYLDDIEKLPGQTKKVDLSGVRKEITELHKAAADFNTALGKSSAKLGSAGPAKLTAINRLLIDSERDLTLDPGLPNRPWFRHRLYAPGLYTGYDVKTVPGVREAVELGRPQEAEEQARQVAQVIHTLSGHVSQAAKLLGTL